MLICFQVIDYYTQKGIAVSLHAEKPPKDVAVEIKEALK
jgi:adenylate kinase family enzyme